ncbi:MAG: ABC transporter ATP-binding protein [Candidatus Micrarchaeota archaeon]
MDVVVCDKITKFYGAKKALDEVSLRVPKGSLYAIAGLNGSGKTTLINVIARVLRPSSGALKVEGKLAYSFQNPRLVADLNVRENLNFFSDLYEINDAGWKNKVLELTGAGEWLRYRIEDLSSGMRKRVELAVALLPDPDIFALDEPTAGLDAESAEHILGLMRALRTSHGKTLIVSTHTLGELKNICDHLAILRDGRKIFDSPAGKIKNLEETYKKFLKT